MRAIGTPPEADLSAVSRGDLSGISTPILIAAATREQFDAFVWEQALICSEVRRFRNTRFAGLEDGKILLLLPGYHHDPATNAAVEWWVNQEDRYTAQLDSPRPCIEKDMAATRRSLLLMAAAVLAVCAWVMFR